MRRIVMPNPRERMTDEVLLAALKNGCLVSGCEMMKELLTRGPQNFHPPGKATWYACQSNDRIFECAFYFFWCQLPEIPISESSLLASGFKKDTFEVVLRGRPSVMALLPMTLEACHDKAPASVLEKILSDQGHRRDVSTSNYEIGRAHV